MFTWGYPQHGRLGHSFAAQAVEAEADVLRRCVCSPKRVEALTGARIQNMALGNDHTMLAAHDGRLFRFASHQACCPASGLGTPFPRIAQVKSGTCCR